MSNLLEIIIPSVNAQSTDATAQPTFGPISVQGSTTINNEITLTADKQTAKVGEFVTVKVRFKTNTTPINEFRLVIKYDSTKLTVIDNDATSTGTQVKLLNDAFEIVNPQNDNKAVNGVITVSAKARENSAFQVNNDVLEIRFQTQSAGNALVNLDVTASGTRLARQNGSSLSYKPNELTIAVQTGQQNNNNGGNNSNNGNNNGGGVIIIPDTSIVNHLQLFIGISGGLMFLVIGTILALGKGKRK